MLTRRLLKVPFSFAASSSNAAYSHRKFSADEVLVVAVTQMKSGERLRLQRCGNDRCSIAASVAEWASTDLEAVPAEVRTESNRRYALSLFDVTTGIVGTHAIVEGEFTLLRFESGTTFRVAVHPLR